MPEEFQGHQRSWVRKFRDAFRGTVLGVRRQNSFAFHFVFAGAVILLAGLLKVTLVEWCVLLLCIFAVLTAEMFNSALEVMAKAIDRRHNPRLAESLDIASAAVLSSSVGSAIVGLVIFGHRLLMM